METICNLLCKCNVEQLEKLSKHLDDLIQVKKSHNQRKHIMNEIKLNGFCIYEELLEIDGLETIQLKYYVDRDQDEWVTLFDYTYPTEITTGENFVQCYLYFKQLPVPTKFPFSIINQQGKFETIKSLAGFKSPFFVLP